MYRVALMALLASCSFAQKVYIEFDKGVDFSKFKTYMWLESKHPAEGLWAQRVMVAIDRQLAEKGLQRGDGTMSPDLEVVYNSGVKERTIVEGYDYGYAYLEYLYSRYGPRWFFWSRELGSQPSEIDKNGTLIVDLVDTSMKEMIWRGVATDTLSDKAKKNERKLDHAIEKMFKKYPPKKARKCKGE